MSPRALVVRSGENPIPFASEPLSIEIVEKVSHVVVALREGIEALDQPADLAIFTSKIAVRRLFEEPDLAAAFGKAIPDQRVAAIGPATADALTHRGLPPSIVASGSSENILERLPASLEGRRILLPTGQDSNEELREGLIHRGARVASIVLYRKKPRPRDPEIERDFLAGAFRAFCPTSPAAARWLFEGLSPEALDLVRRVPAVALGRFTARFLGAHGIARVEMTSEATFSCAARLLEAMAAEEKGGAPSTHGADWD